jgi:hypothetical protein
MTRLRTGVWATALLAVLAATAAAAPTRAEGTLQRPLLLELFTSQSCSSCPPADALLHELAGHPDLLALEFHVDYWNDLGWVDSCSSPAFTARQQQYAALRGFRVYTPQLVVDGRADAIGSSRREVSETIDAARGQAKAVPSGLSRAGQTVKATVGSGGTGTAADVYLLSFDSRGSVSVRGGENAGRTLGYTNVVRSLRKIGEWHGQPLELSERLLPQERGERLALLVQDAAGTVWAVASTPAAGT